MTMNHSSAAELDMEVEVEVDLDSLLQSLGSDTESDEEDRHRRTVDEILLNHSSTSPSSPTLDNNDGVSATWRDGGLSHSHSITLVDSHSYKANPASNSSIARVLPPLFGNGAIRSNAKPGAALAAAAAAARSIPTPHAAAIKLRRANTVVPTLQTADFDSSRAQSQEEEEIEEAPLGTIVSPSSDRDVYYPEAMLSNGDSTLDEGETSGVDKDAECAMPTCQSHNASSTVESSENDQIHVIEQFSSPLFSEKNEEYPEASGAADESGDGNEMELPTPAFGGVEHNEDTTGGEDSSDFGNIVAEPGDGDDTSDAADLLEDLVSRGESEDHCTNVQQQQSDSSLKPLDLAEEIETKQAFTGLHYEEGAAAQPMRLEGIKRGSTVLGYFDIRSDNAITQTISSQVFLRDHGSPQVLAVHLNYIAVGMSKGSIFVVPSKYTAHHVDNMDTKVCYYTYVSIADIINWF